MSEFTIEFRTALFASADDVWAHASTMAGVNDELGPWLRMTVPQAVRERRLSELTPGGVAFSSVLLLLGVVPFDRHYLRIERVLERGFDEESWSWLQRRWRHERRIEADGEGCIVIDRLTVSPRFAPVAQVESIVRGVFETRHKRLRARFGHRPR